MSAMIFIMVTTTTTMVMVTMEEEAMITIALTSFALHISYPAPAHPSPDSSALPEKLKSGDVWCPPIFSFITKK